MENWWESKEFLDRRKQKENRGLFNIRERHIRVTTGKTTSVIDGHCCNFRKKFSLKSKEEKISELKRLALKKVKNIIPYHSRRCEKVRVGNSSCYCCGEKANTKHHIILVKNGGNSHWSNLIPICSKCHSEIHEWLATQEIQKKEKAILSEAWERFQ